MTDPNKTFRVFYSWQSDSPKETNLNAIRTALRTAAKRIGAKKAGLTVIPDEATRDTSGAPNIAIKILEKIDIADAFVADVTTVTAAGSLRPCPNPNVTFELGYAVATLGWDRILLLFNTELGSFPADLPFDFVQHRASPFQSSASNAKAAQAELAAFLEMAIATVIDKNPKRPAELRGYSREKIAHDHDVDNIKWLMSTLHIPTVDAFVERMPHSFHDRTLWFYEHFNGVATNSLFSLYDPVVKSAVDKFASGWTRALSHDNQYHETSSGVLYVFSNPGDMPLTGDQRTAWAEIATAIDEMRDSLAVILGRLRESYMEVNIRSTNKAAWDDYLKDGVEPSQKVRSRAKPQQTRKSRKKVVRKVSRKSNRRRNSRQRHG